MNKGTSAWQCGQETRSVRDGAIAISPSQERHWKWMLAAVMSLIFIVSVSGGLQAQSLAAIARQERERHANSRPPHVLTSGAPAGQAEETKTAGADSPIAAPQKDAGKQVPVSAVDPVQAWNKQVDEARAKIRSLQDRELDLLHNQNEAANQVYAPITDPASHERAQAQLGDIQQQLTGVRKDLEDARKKLNELQAQGPPKR